jgi:hypothetical protein
MMGSKRIGLMLAVCALSDSGRLGVAHAQALPFVPASAAAPSPAGEQGKTTTLTSEEAMQPLRLSIDTTEYPLARSVPGCPQPSGSLQLPSSSKTVRLVGPLVLVGFSTQAACPVDAHATVGLVMTIPIQPRLWLVASAGTTVYPSVLERKPRFDARVDLVWKATPSNQVNLGVDARGRVWLGGGF